MMNKKSLMSILLAGAAIFSVGASSGFAQSPNSAMDEIAILREDLKILQRQVYRTNTDINPTSAADFAVKIGEFDEEIRKMNGKIDELGFKIKSLEDKIDIINKDTDVRMKMLEGRPMGADSGASAASTVSMAAAIEAESAKRLNSAPVSAPAKKVGDGSFAAPVATGAPKSIVGDSIDTGNDLAPVKTQNAEQLYQAGLEALKNSDYVTADQNFNSILKRYPDDKLAGNAQYWLGEVYYVKKDWQRAAIAFAKGLEKYKSGAKGADSLLKLGLSMRELGKKDQACQSFNSMKTEFPKADQTVVNRAQEEAKKLGCK